MSLGETPNNHENDERSDDDNSGEEYQKLSNQTIMFHLFIRVWLILMFI